MAKCNFILGDRCVWITNLILYKSVLLTPIFLKCILYIWNRYSVRQIYQSLLSEKKPRKIWNDWQEFRLWTKHSGMHPSHSLATAKRNHNTQKRKISVQWTKSEGTSWFFFAWKDFWPFLLIFVSNNEISFSRKSSIQLTKRTDIWSKRVLKSNSCSRVCEWLRFLWINIDTVSIHQVDTVFSFSFICLENKSLTWPGKGWVWKKKKIQASTNQVGKILTTNLIQTNLDSI